LQRGRAGGIPDVLADIDADLYPGNLEDGALCAGLEIAVLVEDPIVG
jgi:hypothetical protein